MRTPIQEELNWLLRFHTSQSCRRELWEQLQGELGYMNYELRPCGRSNLVREPRPKVGGGKNHRLSQACAQAQSQSRTASPFIRILTFCFSLLSCIMGKTPMTIFKTPCGSLSINITKSTLAQIQKAWGISAEHANVVIFALHRVLLYTINYIYVQFIYWAALHAVNKIIPSSKISFMRL